MLLTTRALPQASTGTIGGSVSDQSAAAIPGARMLLTNVATNVQLSTRTNEAGVYLGDGFLNTRSSGQTPRSLQLGLRLSW